MDQPPAQSPAPKSNPFPLIFIAVGGAGCFGVLLLGAVLAWIFWPSSKPQTVAPATASTSTVLAAKETVVGEPGSAQVTVPAGAVDKDVSFAITPQSKEPRTSPGVRVVGKVWSLKVDGRSRFKFNKPVRVALPFERGLAKTGNAATLSWWDGRRWQEVAGSRVEGDRVVGDVDHFTDFGATEKDPETAVPPTWTDISAWYGTFEITTYGHWSTNYVIQSSDWTVSRSGSANFRLTNPWIRVNTGKWSIPAKPSPEDRWTATTQIADGGFDTDTDNDRSGNVFYFSTWTGGGSASKLSADLEIDASAGTYRLSVFAAESGNVDFAYRSSPFGDTRSGKSIASFSFQSGPQPLPSALGSISGSVSDVPSKINGGIGGSDIDTIPAPKNAIRTEVSWTLSPGPPGLKARIAGPRFVKRGDGISLDGSTSTGEIVEYRWTFDVGAGGPKGPQEKVEFRTPAVNFTALWDFKATLEIKDKSGKTDTAVRNITVTPRKGYEWELRFPKKEQPKPLLLTSDLRAGSADRVSTLHFGINLCAKDGDVDYSGHYIHRKPSRVQDVDKPTWADVGYEVIKVGDPGPFGGIWFVLKTDLEIDRTQKVNKNLMPGGEVYVLNEEKRNLQDVLNLWQQVKEHERQHTELAWEEFAKVRREKADPAIALEKTFDLAKSGLIEAADKLVMNIDSRIATASDEEKVKAKLRANPKFQKDVSIWLYKDEGGTLTPVKRPLGKLWNVGDDQKDDGN
jgi:hypothetical protein